MLLQRCTARFFPLSATPEVLLSELLRRSRVLLPDFARPFQDLTLSSVPYRPATLNSVLPHVANVALATWSVPSAFT